jgi:hypothetical protein
LVANPKGEAALMAMASENKTEEMVTLCRQLREGGRTCNEEAGAARS